MEAAEELCKVHYLFWPRAVCAGRGPATVSESGASSDWISRPSLEAIKPESGAPLYLVCLIGTNEHKLHGLSPNTRQAIESRLVS